MAKIVFYVVKFKVLNIVMQFSSNPCFFLSFLANKNTFPEVLLDQKFSLCFACLYILACEKLSRISIFYVKIVVHSMCLE